MGPVITQMLFNTTGIEDIGGGGAGEEGPRLSPEDLNIQRLGIEEEKML